ncbi:P-loop containing nucleoside triphosphate hydrolase protein [Syncephalis fuscata]|nr:P-loop containing nucleoside triphosphate hydrolase protein [Syncephalis fuscata]
MTMSIDEIAAQAALVGMEAEVRELARWLVGFQQRVAFFRRQHHSRLSQPSTSLTIPSLHPSGGLVMGQPGTGKTALVQSVAEASNLPFMTIEAPNLFQATEGESERRLIQQFIQLATQSDTLVALLIIEEIDILSPPADRYKSDIETRLLQTLLRLIDEGLPAIDSNESSFSPAASIFIIGVTNRPEAVSAELTRSGRLDRKLVMGPRHPEQRQSILFQLTKQLPFTNDENRRILCQEMAKQAHGFVAADLERLCNEVANELIRDISDTPSATTMSIEDLSLWIRALNNVQPANLSGLQTKIPNVTLTDLFGLDNIIKELQKTVLRPFKHPEHYAQFQVDPPRGLLIHGPPGVGKTLLCCALAREIGINFVWVQGTQIRSMIVGESERALANLFARARANAPCILFIDQIDALVPRRGTSSSSEGTGDRIVTGFLTEMDGFYTKHRTSNSAIHQTVLQRQQILQGKLARIPNCVDPATIDRLANNDTNGCTGADLDNICREAAMQCIREHADAAALVNDAHLQHAISICRRSLTAK